MAAPTLPAAAVPVAVAAAAVAPTSATPVRPAMAAQAAMQVPCAVLQVANAAGTPEPAVKVPAVYPSAPQHATHAVLHPV